MTKKKKVNSNVIKVGFLDDEKDKLKEFESFFSKKTNIMSCLYTQSIKEAVGWAINEQIDVLVSDLILEQEDNGVDVLKSAWDVNKELVLILYSAFVMKPKQRKICEQIKATTIRKHEGLQTLFYNIVQLSEHESIIVIPDTEENIELKKMLLLFSSKLIDDLESLQKEAPNFKIHYGINTYTASQLLKELNNFTDIGKNFMRDYFHGKNILKENG